MFGEIICWGWAVCGCVMGPKGRGLLTSVLRLRREDGANALASGRQRYWMADFLIYAPIFFSLSFLLNPETFNKAKKAGMRLLRLLSECA